MRPILALLTLAVVALVAAACGGDDPTATPTAAPTATPTQATSVTGGTPVVTPTPVPDEYELTIWVGGQGS